MKALGGSGLDKFLSGVGPWWKRLVVVTFFVLTFPMIIFTFVYKELSRSGPVLHDFMNASFALQPLLNSVNTLYILFASDRFRSLMLDLSSFHCNRHHGLEARTAFSTEATFLGRVFKYMRSLGLFMYFAWIVMPMMTSKSLSKRDIPYKYPFPTDYFPINVLILCLETIFACTNLAVGIDCMLVHLTIFLMITCQFRVHSSSIQSDNPIPLNLFVEDHIKLIK